MQSVSFGNGTIIITGTDPVTIGKIIRSTWSVPQRDGYFHGAIDDIRLYNRALSDAEILAIYNENGWPVNPPPPPSVSLSVTPTTPTAYCPDQPTTVRYNLSGEFDSIRVEPQTGVLFRSSSQVHLLPDATTTYRITAFSFGEDPPCTDTVSLVDSVTVTVFDPPAIENSPVYDCIGKVREIGMEVRGGEGPYTWQWQPATGLSDPRVQWPSLEITTDMDYRVIVTDARGCRDTARVSLTALEAPVVDILRVDAEDTSSVADTLYLCDPDAGIELIAEPKVEELFLGYRWIEGDGLDRTDTSHVSARPTDTTTYVVEMARAGCYAYDTIVVIPTSRPEIDAGSDRSICPGESLQIGSTMNNAGLVYAWSSPGTLDDPSLPRPTATPTATTTYYVTATDPVTGCVGVDSVVVAVTDVQISLDRTIVEFGTLDGCTSELREEVVVRNGGSDPAELLTGGSSDGVVQITGSPIISAGGESTVALLFAPAEAGDFSGEVVLRFGPCGDSLVVAYTGRRATASVTLDRRSIDFGRMADCEVDSAEQVVIVRNNGTDPATIEAPGLTTPYGVLSPALPVTIEAGDSTAIIVSYAPTTSGTYTTTMALPYQTGSCSDSLRVLLAGEVYTPTLTTEPDVLDFGLLDGCTADTTITLSITNPGEEDITVSDVELPAEVTLLTPLTRVPAGGSLTLQVRYAPGATGSLGGSMNIMYGPCPAGLGLQLLGEKRGVSFALSDTLDFGELCLGEAAMLPLAVLLNSEGTGDGAVVEAVFTGAGFAMDAMDQMDIMDADGAALADGVAREFRLEFEPTAEGTITGRLRLRLEPCGVERTVVLRGSATSVQLTSSGLDFGTVASGTTTTGVLSYTNTGTSELHIDQLDELAMNGTPFTVVSTTPPLPVDLAPGMSVEIEVEYVVAAGPSTAMLGAVVAGACDTTVMAAIRGTGELNSGLVRLKLPQLGGEPGEALQLTLEVTDVSGVPAEGVGFRAEVSVEPSILSVADATSWRIANDGQRVIEIEGVVRPNESVAASVPVIALLGRVESSPLALISIELSDPTQQVALEVEDGSLEILGLCREGGVRLFDPSGEIAIKSISPSPTQDQMTITYSLSETGEHRMMLVDAGGREVLEIFSGMMLPGTFELVRDVTSLPSGAYRLVLETPTLRVSEGVVIGR